MAEGETEILDEGEWAPAGGRTKDRCFLAVVLVLIGGYFALFTTLSILKYANFRTPGVDLAIFDQVLWLMSRFEGATSTIRGMNLFGDHMAPVFFLIAPLYWLKGNAQALLVLQTAALSLGALAVYLAAGRRLESPGLALVLSAAYLMYPALQHMNLFDFHPETLGLCFLLFAFLAVERRRLGWFYVLCLLAVVCKEDLALAVFILGLIVYFKYDRRAGRLVAAGSAVYFLVMVLVVIPLLGPEGFQYSGRLSRFGDSPLEAVKNMVLRPLRTLDILATRANLRYIIDLLGPLAFLPLLAPLMLLPAVPAFIINIISDFPSQRTILYQYTAAIIPFLFIALIFALEKLEKRSAGASGRRFINGAFGFVLITCSVAGNFLVGPSPISETWTLSNYRSDHHIEVIRKGLSKIPEDAAVSAQIYLLPHLSRREKIYMFPNPFIDLVDRGYVRSLDLEQRKFMWPGVYRRLEHGYRRGDYPVPRVDYVALDRGVDPWPMTDDPYRTLVRRLKKSRGFEVVYDREGVIILRRSGSSGPPPAGVLNRAGPRGVGR